MNEDKKYAIEVENVSKSFKAQEVIKDISVKWELGKIHGLIGQNGSGKTVLIKCICGFMKPDSGKILVLEKEIGKDVEMPQKTGVVFDNPGLIGHLSAFKNLMAIASIQGKINADAVKKALETVSLDSEEKKPVRKYSLGMKQRLSLAQALMENPELLILDEPFNGLDKKGTQEIRALLKSLKEQGKTILIISHNPIDINELCDSICEIDSGVLSVIKS